MYTWPVSNELYIAKYVEFEVLGMYGKFRIFNLAYVSKLPLPYLARTVPNCTVADFVPLLYWPALIPVKPADWLEAEELISHQLP